MQFAIRQHFHIQGWLPKIVPQFLWPTTLRHWADTHLNSSHTGENAALTGDQPWQSEVAHSIQFPSHQLKSSKPHRSLGAAPHFSVLYFSQSQSCLTNCPHSCTAFPHEGTVPPQPVGPVRDLWCRAGVDRQPPHTSYLHLFWSWICPYCHPESLLGNCIRWTG